MGGVRWRGEAGGVEVEASPLFITPDLPSLARPVASFKSEVVHLGSLNVIRSNCPARNIIAIIAINTYPGLKILSIIIVILQKAVCLSGGARI